MTKVIDEGVNSVKSIQKTMEKYNERKKTKGTPQYGLGMLCSALLKNITCSSIGASMAAFVLEGNERFGFSHKQTNLVLNHYTDYLQEHLLHVTLGDSRTFFDTVLKYVHRSEELNNVSLYDFVSYYGVCTISSVLRNPKYIHDVVEDIDDDEEKLYYKFAPTSAMSTTHVIYKHQESHIPNIIGKRCPNRNDLFIDYDKAMLSCFSENEISSIHSKREEYALHVITLLYP